MSSIRLTSPQDIDLDRHGDIIASAGTGKTYTLEHLYARLVVEKGIPVERILAVTFTEKAAAEMRDRVQKHFASAACATTTSILGARLNDARIFTIHGFCRRVLAEHPFQTGFSPDRQLMQERTVFEEALKEMKLRVWKKAWGAAVGNILSIADIDAAWDETLLKRASAYHPAFVKLIPAPSPRRLLECADGVWSGLAALAELLALPTSATLPERYSRLNFNAATREAFLKNILKPLMDAFASSRMSRPGMLKTIRRLMGASQNADFKERGFLALVPAKWNGGRSNLEEVAPDLSAVAAAADLVRRALEEFEPLFDACAVADLHAAARALKMKKGWMTYGDMIHDLHEALARPDSELLTLLRASYDCVLIDEGQDTDAAQWEIFRRIFIDPADGRHRLYLIGDPKQAIYSFRGADVKAYLAARAAIIEAGGASYTLSTGYRQSPPLLEALNGLFREKWFLGSGAEYAPVAPVSSEHRPHLLKGAGDAKPALCVVRLASSGGRAKTEWIARMVEEIGRLAASETVLGSRRGGVVSARRAGYGDIAVLCQTRAEAEAVEAALVGAGIPCTFYKKEGIFSSAESLRILYLLDGMAHVHDHSRISKALLSGFFDISPEDLAPVGDDGARSARHAAALAMLGEWKALFAAIPPGAALDAILFRSCILRREAAEKERFLSNFRQVAEFLDETCPYAATPEELYRALLAQYRNDGMERQEENVFRIESDAARVQIMTIHASKGLEFPFVFIGGGLTRGTMPPRGTAHDEGGALVMDFTEAGAERLHAEKEEELRRLYYVALTRAIFRLSLPLPEEPRRGSPGPVAGFVRERILESRLTDSPASDDADVLSRTEFADAPSFAPAARIEPRAAPEVAKREPRIESFTSLARSASFAHDVAETGVRFIDDEERDEFAVARAGDSEEILPPGAATGTLLHELLESAPCDRFMAAESPHDTARDSEIISLIRSSMAARPIFEGANAACRDEIEQETARLLWLALRTPFIDGKLCVAELPPADRLNEVTFMTRAGSNGFRVTGTIDLCFRAKGKYHLLDWKSNLLHDYSRESLRRAMEEHSYNLQCELYCAAAVAWFSTRIFGFKPERDFAGMHYVFLRGLDAAEPLRGVLTLPYQGRGKGGSG